MTLQPAGNYMLMVASVNKCSNHSTTLWTVGGMLIPIYLTKWEITNAIIGHQCRATHGWYRMHIHQKSHSSYSKRYSSLGLKQYYPQFLKRSALLSLKEIETFHSHIFLPTYEMRAAAFVTSSHRGQQNAAKIQPLHHKTEHLPPSNNEMQKKK